MTSAADAVIERTGPDRYLQRKDLAQLALESSPPADVAKPLLKASSAHCRQSARPGVAPDADSVVVVVAACPVGPEPVVPG
jgi:hypothetical protein